MFTVLFYPREWEHLGNSHCLVFSERRIWESKKIFSRKFYGISENWNWRNSALSVKNLWLDFGMSNFWDTFKINIKKLFRYHKMLLKIQNPWHSGKHSKKENHKICQKACRTLIVLIFNCLIFFIFVLNFGLFLGRLKIQLGFGSYSKVWVRDAQARTRRS